jgi:hypothetical protein
LELVVRASPNPKPHVPDLFKEIIRNDNERQAIHDSIMHIGLAEGQAAWRRLKELHAEKKEYRSGAEKALKWNKDKGTPA